MLVLNYSDNDNIVTAQRNQFSSKRVNFLKFNKRQTQRENGGRKDREAKFKAYRKEYWNSLPLNRCRLSKTKFRKVTQNIWFAVIPAHKIKNSRTQKFGKETATV